MPKQKKWTLNLAIKASVIILGLFYFSWLHATHFDSTEMKMIAEVAGLAVVVLKFFPD